MGEGALRHFNNAQNDSAGILSNGSFYEHQNKPFVRRANAWLCGADWVCQAARGSRYAPWLPRCAGAAEHFPLCVRLAPPAHGATLDALRSSSRLTKTAQSPSVR